jgi:hypothetical protein
MANLAFSRYDQIGKGPKSDGELRELSCDAYQIDMPREVYTNVAPKSLFNSFPGMHNKNGMGQNIKNSYWME